MTLATYSGLAVVMLAGMVSARAVGAEDELTAISMKSNDGIYAVHATTRQGGCDKDNYWVILVSGGRVSSTGDAIMEASGQINTRGAVNLQFARFGQVAVATGRVTGGAGTGTWTSPTLNCSGSWRATRRG